MKWGVLTKKDRKTAQDILKSILWGTNIRTAEKHGTENKMPKEDHRKRRKRNEAKKRIRAAALGAV
jgi:hypothetical protein